MELSQAIDLINNDFIDANGPTTWADLGCGTGLFTNALAHLLKPGSKIVAVDTNASSLNSIPTHKHITIEKLQVDFVKEDLPLKNLDGILMANSLHFVKDKIAFIHKAEKYLKKDACFLLVEYDMDTANQWVPYPFSFNSLENLFKSLGYSYIVKLNEMPSIYNRANIYSAIISK